MRQRRKDTRALAKSCEERGARAWRHAKQVGISFIFLLLLHLFHLSTSSSSGSRACTRGHVPSTLPPGRSRSTAAAPRGETYNTDCCVRLYTLPRARAPARPRRKCYCGALPRPSIVRPDDGVPLLRATQLSIYEVAVRNKKRTANNCMRLVRPPSLRLHHPFL